MKTSLFPGWKRKAGSAQHRVEVGEMTVHVRDGGNPSTVAVAGRVTVDTSPHLRFVLLGLIRRRSAATLVVDTTAVSYVDMSGIATFLEALKSAHERSVKLCLTGMSGQAKALSEIAQLDRIFHAWGAEVEFR